MTLPSDDGVAKLPVLYRKTKNKTRNLALAMLFATSSAFGGYKLYRSARRSKGGPAGASANVFQVFVAATASLKDKAAVAAKSCTNAALAKVASTLEPLKVAAAAKAAGMATSFKNAASAKLDEAALSLTEYAAKTADDIIADIRPKVEEAMAAAIKSAVADAFKKEAPEAV